MKNNSPKLIILSGGGTGGSVTPLLALAEHLRREDSSYRFLFLGTHRGPERGLVVAEGLEFRSMLSGKWRRYFSWLNFLDIFLIFLAFWQSFYWLIRYRPALIISAGSFVSVPLVWAGRIIGIKSVIHQQDWRAGLANKLMAKAANKITVTFEKSLADYGSAAVWIGNPIKEVDAPTLLLWQKEVMEKYHLTDTSRLILIIGGGTGSIFLNRLGASSQKELAALGQVVHVSGQDKELKAIAGYQVFPILPHRELLALESLAKVIVSRCGLGALTEICYFQKPAILVPMPQSHQEDNARYFAAQSAALVLPETNLTSAVFVGSVKKMLEEGNKYAANLEKIMKPGAVSRLAQIVKELL